VTVAHLIRSSIGRLEHHRIRWHIRIGWHVRIYWHIGIDWHSRRPRDVPR
jgi:hypothetical protein